MRRGAKPGKAKVVAKRPRPRTSPNDEASKRPDLEKRLAESLEREKAKDRALTEALEQQTATSEILRVISSSPGDIQPVFDAIAANAARLCDAVNGLVIRFDGQLLHIAAHHNVDPARLAAVRQAYPRPPSRGALSGRAILTRAVVNVPDVSKDPEYTLPAATTIGYRSVLAVPMMHEGVARGTILVARDVVAPFSDTHIALIQTFADQAVIAIENVRLFTELQARNREVTEALDQKTATSEILRVIASSPTDLQPVFDTIAERAMQLCNAAFGAVHMFDGTLIHINALANWNPEGADAVRRAFPMAPSRASMTGRVILTGDAVEIPDVHADPEYHLSDLAQAARYRSSLGVPMLHRERAIGVVVVGRPEPGRFPEEQIQLLKTFADQAVIAIENVRLFTELEARNRDLTATSEVLQVISRSPTDVQPVFDTILANAARLCDAHRGALLLFRDGVFETGAELGTPLGLSDARKTPYRPEPHSHSLLARIVAERRAIFVPDLRVHRAYEEREPRTVAAVELAGSRSLLAVPLLKEDVLIGVITIHRPEPGPFSEEHISLLKTFADQAVIAIENVRLFTELQASNRELTTALDQQTATSDILRVISQSQTNVQPVFDAIVASAVRLLGAYSGMLTRVAGDQIELAALTSTDEAGDAALRAVFPRSLQFEGPYPKVIRDRAPLNIADAHNDPRLSEAARATYRIRGSRSQVVVPLLRHDEAVGALGVTRREAGGFTDDEIALLKTFADQAVIAIENVRLFNELEGRNRDLTATSEILRVISQSPTDVQPVFDTIVQSARALCGADSAAALSYDGEQLQIESLDNPNRERADALRQVYPMPANRGHATGRAILTGRPVHIPDVREDPEYALDALRDTVDLRSVASVPMVRDGATIGAITVQWWTTPRSFSDKQISLLQTFADQAVIAIENVRLFTELQQKNGALTEAHAQVSEALEQQTATSEILKVISRSPTDIRPVLDALAESAGRLCGSVDASIYRRDGDRLILVAQVGPIPQGVIGEFFLPLGRATVVGRSVADGRTVHVLDLKTMGDEFPEGQKHARRLGLATVLAVPLIREGVGIGSMSLRRTESQLFTPQQVTLLETFADQAVIAIENVRLFKELEARNADLTEALAQQTATAEILRSISASPTDYQPVFNTIVRNAGSVCGAVDALLWTVDGDELVARAHHGPIPGTIGSRQPVRGSVAGRAVSEARVVHVEDLTEADEFPVGRDIARRAGWRTTLGVPLLREGAAAGAILIRRSDVRLFTPKEIALLQTFADQAVIAIENVRLFTELQASNRELTTALDTQTATADILRVISRSQTDVQPVFDAILASAIRLLTGFTGALTRLEGDQIMLVALTSTDDASDAAVRAAFPQWLHAGGAHPQTARGRVPLNVADAHSDARLMGPEGTYAKVRGYQSLVVVPLLRHDEAIGTLSVTRRGPGGFTDDEIALLQTFADQAVIAIENVRLFNELEGRNRDLTATSEILRVISSSPTDVQPVFDTIVRSAVRLCDGLFSALHQFDGELLHLVAHHNYSPEALEEVRRLYPARPSRGQGFGRAILERELVHIPDVEVDPEYQARALSRAIGFRSGLFVPMLREGVPIGAIMVARAKPGPFSDNEIELLKTFADQAVIAVENVRLFKELQARTGELTQSVEQLTALGEVSRAVSSTLDVETVLDTIVSRASQLAGAAGCSIFEYDAAAEQFELRATHNADTAFVEALRAVPLRKGEGLMGRATEMREPIQIPDITQPGAYQSSVRDTLIRFGYRALLAVPLLREGQIIGSLSFNRKAAGEFPPEVVDVLKTFATQSALAIQNARLFREIADKSRQLEAASRHKSEFLANMSHELRTPLNAIIGFSEILAEKMFGDINEKQTEYLQDILESGRHLLSLINDILDLSKIEAGRMELELSDFHLPSAIENALTLVRERASRRGIKLGSTIDERLGIIAGDERKVKQVLLNLLSNALKFTPEGGRIDVRAVPHDGVAEISVADTGVGIAPEDQDAVFEEFRQVGTADKKVEGTGLGLALSRKFIELHGGRIWVKSQVGHGSTFTFTLPVHRGG